MTRLCSAGILHLLAEQRHDYKVAILLLLSALDQVIFIGGP